MLQVKKIPFTSYDMASDEDAKKLWKRKAPLGECPSSFDFAWFALLIAIKHYLNDHWVCVYD